MLKRSTKSISLLVAAVSIMSTTPAMAAAENSNGGQASATAKDANSQIKTLEALEGTISNAKAYGNGAFLVDGYKNDNDDTEIYYATSDGKFNKIDSSDIESGDTLGDKLEGQYVEILDDSGNAAYVDIKNGYKVVDDDIRETMADNAASKLRKTIKKDDSGRFDKTCFDNTIKAYARAAGQTSTFINGSTNLWSHYNYNLDKKYSYSGAKNYSAIYADTSGNYIDGDYNLGRITVSMEETTGASVSIKNTDDIYEIKDNGITYDLKAEIKEDLAYLNEQKDSIVRSAYLTIYKKEKDQPESAYIPATSQLYFGDDDNRHKITSGNSARVFQIFSKEAASDTVDGIKYPKNSDIYFLTDEDGEAETLLGYKDSTKLGISGNGAKVIQFNAVTGFVGAYIDTDNNEIYAEHFTPTQKNGYKYLDIDTYKHTDIKGSAAYSGSSGDLGCLSDGYLKFWDGKDFVKKYRVDGSLNNLSINNKDNAIMWNEDSGVYSIVYNQVQAQGVQAVAATGNGVKTASTTGAQAAWVKNTDSSWSYIKQDGSKAVGWIQDASNKLWYYMDDNGIMSTDKWIEDRGKWYFLKPNGSMATGWIQSDGRWYYLDLSGEMLLNTTIDGYTLGYDGAWIQ